MANDKPKRKKFILPKPLTAPMRPDQFAAPCVGMAHEKLVGRLVIEWARLEAVLNDLIWIFLDLSFEDGRAVTGRADASTKIALLRVIAPRHLVSADQLEALLIGLDTIESLREDRNFIMHGSWGRLFPEGVPIAASIRAKSEANEIISQTFTPSRMRTMIELTVVLRQALFVLLDELEASPDTLLK